MKLHINDSVSIDITDREDLIPSLLTSGLIPTNEVHAVWMGDTVYLYPETGSPITIRVEA